MLRILSLVLSPVVVLPFLAVLPAPGVHPVQAVAEAIRHAEGAGRT